MLAGDTRAATTTSTRHRHWGGAPLAGSHFRPPWHSSSPLTLFRSHAATAPPSSRITTVSARQVSIVLTPRAYRTSAPSQSPDGQPSLPTRLSQRQYTPAPDMVGHMGCSSAGTAPCMAWTHILRLSMSSSPSIGCGSRPRPGCESRGCVTWHGPRSL